MKVIVGLGNPGSEYAATRHNVGFMAIDAMAAKYGVQVWRDKFSAQIGECMIGNEKVLLVKPQTYMNLSGEAVGPLLSWYKLPSEQMAVLYDDMDIEVGSARIRLKGSAGGHNGIKSILAHIGTEDFARFRIGIGRPAKGWSVVDHVLAKFSDADRAAVENVVEKIVPAVECFVKNGIDLTMNRYNIKLKNIKQSAEKGGAVQ